MAHPNKGKGKVIAWLREHVSHVGQNCLKYPFYINPKLGYPLFGLDGKMTYAHRWMCEQRNGPPPTPKHEAAHTCGNAHMGCINPNHLEWKTRQQNAQDRLEHGNYSNRKGQRRFILDADKAAKIMEMKGKKTQFEIADMFGVSRCTVSSIHCGRGWTGKINTKVFSDEEVRSIRGRWPAESAGKIGRELGVSPNVIWRICKGRSYTHVL